MIDKALAALVAQLEAFLATRFTPSDRPRVALGPVPDASKDAPPEQPLTFSLVRVEEERVLKAQVAVRRVGNQVHQDVHPELKLNLWVLVSAAAKGYEDTLRFLSAAVSFFQARPVFDRTSCPGLDEATERLLVELYSPGFEEQSQLWGTLSVRYVPSVLYRVRLVVVQEAVPTRVLPPVAGLGLAAVEV